jgi:penicillin-binding protein 1A
VAEFWRRLTIRRQAPEREGRLAIGGSAGTEVSPLILASAYSIFANNGLQLRPTAIRTIKIDGIEQPLTRPSPMRMAEAAPTYIAAQMMRSALEPEGTADQALRLANLPEEAPVVAKTGTGQISSVHFVSVSPKLVVVVWVGLPDNRLSLDMNDGFSSAAVAAPIWAEFMRNGVKRFRSDLLQGEFQRPKNVKVLGADRRQGCVTESGEATELFITGREPSRCSQAPN